MMSWPGRERYIQTCQWCDTVRQADEQLGFRGGKTVMVAGSHELKFILEDI